MPASLLRLRSVALLASLGALAAACGARSTIALEDLPEAGTPADAAAGGAGGGAAGAGGSGAGGAADAGGAGAADDAGSGGAGGGTIAICGECLDATCPMEVADCAGSQGCGCWRDCLESGADRQACDGKCGPPGRRARDLLQCAGQGCAESCNLGGGGTGGGGGGTGGTGPGSAACNACLGQSCASQQGACANDKTCTCWEGCLAANGGNFQGCFGQCGVPNGATVGVLQCAQQSCGAECGGGMGGGGFPGGGFPGN